MLQNWTSEHFYVLRQHEIAFLEALRVLAKPAGERVSLADQRQSTPLHAAASVELY